MTPEASRYLAKAGECLAEARQIADIGLHKIAARSAYYAAFHAAEALIIEKTGKIAKSHSGVRAEFARLTMETSGLDRSFTTFLAQAYLFKEAADYGIDANADLPASKVHEAIVSARRFVDGVATVLGDSA